MDIMKWVDLDQLYIWEVVRSTIVFEERFGLQFKIIDYNNNSGRQ